MPKLVEVPEIGEIEFPDDISEAEMSSAIEQELSSRRPATQAPSAVQAGAEAVVPEPIGGSISGSDPIPEPEPIPDVAPENVDRVRADVEAARTIFDVQMLPTRVDATSIRSPQDRMRAAREAEALSAIAKTREGNTDMFDPAHYEAMDEAGFQQRRADGIYARLATDFPAKKSEEEQRAEFEAQFQKDINERGGAPDAVQTFMHWLVSKGKNVAASALEPVAPGTAKNLRDSASDDTYVGQLGTGASQKVARGAADVAFLVGGNPAGVLGIGVASAKAALDTYSRVLNETKDRNIAMDEAVKTAPAMALYMAGGAAGAALGKAMVPINSAPALRGLGALTGSMIGNIAPSMALRIVEGQSYGIEALTADALLSIYYARGQYKGAVSERAQKRAEAELLSRGFSEQQLQQGYQEGGFRMQVDTPAALVAPQEMQTKIRANDMLTQARAKVKDLLEPSRALESLEKLPEQPPPFNEAPPPSQQPRTPPSEAGDVPPPAAESGTPVERRLGPGAANIEENLGGSAFETSNKEVVVNREREARGLDPVIKEARISNPETIDRAEAVLEADPSKADQIVERLRTNPQERSISLEDGAVMLVAKTDLLNQRRGAEATINDPNSSPEDVVEATEKFNFVENKISAMDQAAQDARSTWGRFGQFYQRTMRDDFTLSTMEARERVNKGRPLTPDEATQVREISERGTKAQKELEERRTELEEGQPVDAAIKAIEAEARKDPTFTPEVRGIAERISAFFTKAAEGARKRMAERRQKVYSNALLDPIYYADAVIIGADYVNQGVKAFKNWASKMASELGDEIIPGLRKIWDDVNASIDKKISAVASSKNREKVKDLLTGKSATEQAEVLGGEMMKKSQDGAKLDDMRGDVDKLVRTLVAGGIKTRGPLVDAVHEVLKTIDPTVTRRQASEAISKYGDFRPLSKDEVSKIVRDLKQQLQLEAKIEDVLASMPLKRSGPERQPLSDEGRAMTKKLNELSRELGIKITNPATQLKSILGALETRLTNRIKDLKGEIAKGERTVKTKSPTPTNEKIEALRRELAEVEAQHEALLGKREMTEEQKLAAYKTRTQKRIGELEKRIADKDFGPRPKKPKLDINKDPEAVKAKAEIERVKSEFAKRQEQWKYDRLNKWQKTWSAVKGGLRSIRNVLGSTDFSALRQAIPAARANPLVTLKSLREMFSAAFSEKRAQEINAEILLRPNAQNGVYKKMGLAITPLNEVNFSKTEENARSNVEDLANLSLKGNKLAAIVKAPLKLAGMTIRMSNRAFVTFLNKVRADLADVMVAANFKDRAPTDADLAAVGDIVNTVTGRGLKQGAGEFASAALYSPNFLMARVKNLSGFHVWRPGATMASRKIALKQGFKQLITWYAIYQAVQLFSDKEKKDAITDSDFGKLVDGRTRVDYSGGEMSLITAASRVARGVHNTATGQKQDQDMLRELAKQYRYKSSPLVGLAIDWITGKDAVGKKTTVGGSIKGLTVPMAWQHVGELFQEHGIPKAIMYQIENLLGAGVNTYDKEKKR